jgi:hypothetical protein
MPAPANTNRGQVSVVRTGAGFDVKIVGDAQRVTRGSKKPSIPLGARAQRRRPKMKISNAMIASTTRTTIRIPIE